MVGSESREIRSSLGQIVEAVRKTGSYAASSTPEGFRQIVQAEIDFWADAAKSANFQPE